MQTPKKQQNKTITSARAIQIHMYTKTSSRMQTVTNTKKSKYNNIPYSYLLNTITIKTKPNN